MGNMVFFLSQEVDGKDDIYWLLRSFCPELFGGKYDLFAAKKLMKRWYLLGLFELSMIFKGLGNMAFREGIVIHSRKKAIVVFKQSYKNRLCSSVLIKSSKR